MKYIEKKTSEDKVFATLNEDGTYTIYGSHCYFPLTFDVDELVEIDKMVEEPELIEQEDEEFI